METIPRSMFADDYPPENRPGPASPDPSDLL
jgi:hypothetical protein